MQATNSSMSEHALTHERPTCQAREDILAPLPNDLIRLIYLASIRDYNSGRYLHPQLSRNYEAEVADRALQVCHHEVFAQLIGTPIGSLVQQLKEYIRYCRTERNQLITTWKSLQAYRSAIPARTSLLSSEVFFLNITIALAILEFERREGD
jgi:hypothetical protein